MPNITLREVETNDLDSLFEQQNDPIANKMAAFPAREREAFFAHWAKILAGNVGLKRTILADGDVAGYIVSFDMEDKREVGYWLGRKYWGRGIATEALGAFLYEETRRPLFAHVAKHNIGSRRVLEKCGFVVYADDTGAGIQGEDVAEWILKLDNQA